MNCPDPADRPPLRSNVAVVANVFPRCRDGLYLTDDEAFCEQVRGQDALKELIKRYEGGVIRIEDRHVQSLPTGKQREEFNEAHRCHCGRVMHGRLRDGHGGRRWADIDSCYCERDERPAPRAFSLAPPMAHSAAEAPTTAITAKPPRGVSVPALPADAPAQRIP